MSLAVSVSRVTPLKFHTCRHAIHFYCIPRSTPVDFPLSNPFLNCLSSPSHWFLLPLFLTPSLTSSLPIFLPLPHPHPVHFHPAVVISISVCFLLLLVLSPSLRDIAQLLVFSGTPSKLQSFRPTSLLPAVCYLPRQPALLDSLFLITASV